MSDNLQHSIDALTNVIEKLNNTIERQYYSDQNETIIKLLQQVAGQCQTQTAAEAPSSPEIADFGAPAEPAQPARTSAPAPSSLQELKDALMKFAKSPKGSKAAAVAMMAECDGAKKASDVPEASRTNLIIKLMEASV